jgi:hypothetical protein
MNINRRFFNKILLSSSALSLIPHNGFSDDYYGPVIWTGSSFLLPYNQIQELMPITKKASELPSDISKADYLNSYLNKTLQDNPLTKVNLISAQGSTNAELALTYSFSAEFDFGTFENLENKSTAYLMYSFGHSLLYNPKTNAIISSVPVRAIATYDVSFEEESSINKADNSDKKRDMKVELMKRTFYNPKNPEDSLTDQFRLMLGKQSFTKKAWLGFRPRVIEVVLPENSDDLFPIKFGLKKEQFIEFVGQASTFAFSYKLGSPILPYMRNKALSAVLSKYSDATKLYYNLTLPLPRPEIEIVIYHDGWTLEEKPLAENAKNALEINLFMGIQIRISKRNKGIIYDQYFACQKKYLETTNGYIRSDKATVCELTEAVLERAFQSIEDKNYRKELINNVSVKSYNSSTVFQLQTDNIDQTNKESNDVLFLLPKVKRTSFKK